MCGMLHACEACLLLGFSQLVTVAYILVVQYCGRAFV